MKTIKEARMEAGLSQAQLSEWLGIPRPTIADWDRGARKPSDWLVTLVVEKIERDAEAWKNNN